MRHAGPIVFSARLSVSPAGGLTRPPAKWRSSAAGRRRVAQGSDDIAPCRLEPAAATVSIPIPQADMFPHPRFRLIGVDKPERSYWHSLTNEFEDALMRESKTSCEGGFGEHSHSVCPAT